MSATWRPSRSHRSCRTKGTLTVDEEIALTKFGGEVRVSLPTKDLVNLRTDLMARAIEMAREKFDSLVLVVMTDAHVEDGRLEMVFRGRELSWLNCLWARSVR